MGFNDKHNNAGGRDPDFGAIFMSNSGTRRECFKRRLFGLPSSEIQFVEKVKAGMILFLFEYEKRQLHGVFKASCDGAVNIVPNAFTASGKQFPAQVKFIPIWSCKPLSEKIFRDAIRENYFSANKFNFGLSENQVHKLLHLFSMGRLEEEVPGRHLTRTEDLKSEWYPAVKVGRSVGLGMHVASVQNEQVVGDNSSPILMHKYQRQGDSSQYNGDVEYVGLNADDIVVNKQGRAAELEVGTRSGYVSDYLQLKYESRITAHENEGYIGNHAAELKLDTSSGYVSDYLALKDESRFTTHDNKDYMDTHPRPYIIGGYSKIPSDKIRVHGDGMLSISDRLMSEDLRKTDQRMAFSDDILGLHDSNANPSVFYSKPILECNSSVGNHLRPISAIMHPVQAQILNNSCGTQGDVSSILYNADAPGLNFRQLSSVGINNGSESIIESTSPSTNYGRNSLNREPCRMHTEMKDLNRCHNIAGGFLNSGFYGSNRDCMPFNEAQNSDQLASESVLYEACNSIPALKSSSAPIPSTDIGDIGRVHEPFSSLFHNCKSRSGNNVHPLALPKNLSHKITLQKNNETFSPDVPWANEGHSQVHYDDSLNHGYDIGCYGDSQNNNSGHPKKKSSVFSRLSFMQDVNKQENGKNAWNEEYDIHTSVDEVMEMARQSYDQWMTKRKPKPNQRNKAESLRDKTQINSSRMKGDCFENTLKDLSMDLTTASGGNSNKTAEEICFVDFKRRSKVRKHSDEIERSSNESKKSENLVLVQQKRRKLIRPKFNKSTTSDDNGIDLGASRNLQVPFSHGSYNLKDVSESCCSLVQTDVEVQNIICPTHAEDKNGSHARVYVCSGGGEKANDGALPAFNVESECVENINQHNVLSSASCKEESCHTEEGSCMMDNIKSVSLEKETLDSICQEHNADKIICAGGGINTDEEMPKDRGSSFSVEVKDGSEYLQNSANEKAPIETSCHVKEGLRVMDSIESVSPGAESLHSTCQEHHLDKIICAERVIDTEKEMSKDGGSSSTVEVKDGFDCLQNSYDENAPITTSCHIKERLCVTDSIKSVSPDTESLHSICQEHCVDKVISAGRGLNTEGGMSKDGNNSFTTEVKDGSDSLQYSSNDNVKIATCEQKMA